MKSSAGQPKMILDMERVTEHLSQASEAWGRYGYGRHLRTKPALSEVGKALKPEKILFTRDLPKTRSAKIVRRAVRACALGTDPGDLSSLENPESLAAISEAARS